MAKQRSKEQRIAMPDLLLIGCLLLFGLWCLFPRAYMSKAGESVKITVDGQDYGTYSLAEKNLKIPIEISGKVTNTLNISDGQAKMVQATCPDKLCMHQNAISKQGGTIVCLPNKIVVEVAGEKEAPLDSISR